MLWKFAFSTRFFSSKCEIPRVCVIGSGPAGWYTSRKLIKINENVKVDMYEKLPIPFGLIRYGVAPDHPAIKKAENEFTKYADHSRFQYIGNVNVGCDISVEDLKKAYHAIIFAYGAPIDRKLGISGEEYVLAASDVVGWYNGVPGCENVELDLDCEEVAVIGHGNVALDISRILLRNVDDLKKTDIPKYALEKLAKSRVKRVRAIGRRGPLQISFTTLEMREMTTLPDFNVILKPQEFDPIRDLIPSLKNPKKRLLELLLQTVDKPKTEVESGKNWCVDFVRSPLEVTKSGKNLKLKLGINKLEGNDVNAVSKSTGESEFQEFGSIIRSVGYCAQQIDPFVAVDAKRGRISNKMTRVEGKDGLYCSGWIQSGPVGVLLSTRNGSYDCAKVVNEDIVGKVLKVEEKKEGFEVVGRMLKEKGIQTVSFKDWLKIDKVEKQRGAKIGKPREKIVSIQEMLEIANS